MSGSSAPPGDWPCRRTPVTRCLPGVVSSATASQRSRTETLPIASTRRLTWPSINGLLASRTSAARASRVIGWPAMTIRISLVDSQGTAPLSTSSPVMPGSSDSIARAPLARSAWACRPWGTALRPSPIAGNVSRSMIVTRA